MKHTFRLAAVLAAVLGLACSSYSQVAGPLKPIKLADDLSITRVADGVYVVTHSLPWASNSMVIAVSKSEIVLVDTPYTPEATSLLLQWVDKRFNPRSIVAVNTHYHIDRLGGNEELARRSILVYGSDHTARLLRERGETLRQQNLKWISDPKVREAHRALRLVAPNHIFRESTGKTLQFSGGTVEISYPGPGHTPDNLVVYYPSKRVLFAGCAIVGNPKLGYMGEADIKSWLQAVDSMSRMDVEIVVPGHGGEDSGYAPSLIAHTRELLLEASQKPK